MPSWHNENSPLAGVVGFTSLPARYFAYLTVGTGAYLLLVEPPGGVFGEDQLNKVLGCMKIH